MVGQGANRCVGMISAKATISRMPAAAGWRRHRRAGRSRRPRYWNRRRPGAAWLGARYRSEPADRRRREPDPQHPADTRDARRRGPASRRTTWAASSAVCWARRRIVGRKSFAKTTRNMKRHGFACSRDKCNRHVVSRRRRSGPFYCPSDKRVYLDTSFFRQLQSRFRACTGRGCEFAQSYVIAHEIGHHVQNLLGVLPRVRRLQQASAEQGSIEPLSGDGGVAGRLLRGRLGQPRGEEEAAFPRAGRYRRGLADRVRDRRRHVAEARARLRGPGLLHSWHFGTAQALVHDGYRDGRVSSCNTFNAAQL